MSKELKVKPLGMSLIDFLSKKNKPAPGLVFFFPENPSKKLVITYFVQECDVARDGPYYRYDMDYVELKDVIAGKRGAKVNKVYLNDLSSMSSSVRKAVAGKPMYIEGSVNLKHLPEVVKVVEKEGWSLK